jgi:hypothetical protein
MLPPGKQDGMFDFRERVRHELILVSFPLQLRSPMKLLPVLHKSEPTLEQVMPFTRQTIASSRSPGRLPRAPANLDFRPDSAAGRAFEPEPNRLVQRPLEPELYWP